MGTLKIQMAPKMQTMCVLGTPGERNLAKTLIPCLLVVQFLTVLLPLDKLLLAR